MVGSKPVCCETGLLHGPLVTLETVLLLLLLALPPLRIDEELLRPDGRHENSAHQSSGQDHHVRASVDRHRMTPSLRRGGQPPRTGFSLSLT